MEEVGGLITDKVQSLSDIELAVLLCLIADQHCVIEAEDELLPGLKQELQLVCIPSNLSRSAF